MTRRIDTDISTSEGDSMNLLPHNCLPLNEQLNVFVVLLTYQSHVD